MGRSEYEFECKPIEEKKVYKSLCYQLVNNKKRNLFSIEYNNKEIKNYPIVFYYGNSIYKHSGIVYSTSYHVYADFFFNNFFVIYDRIKNKYHWAISFKEINNLSICEFDFIFGGDIIIWHPILIMPPILMRSIIWLCINL
jgi:hypothetical protein